MLARVDIRGADVEEAVLETLRAAAPEGCEVVWEWTRRGSRRCERMYSLEVERDSLAKGDGRIGLDWTE